MKVMILAAGRGERMRPLTDTVPKPLLVAGLQPLIGWHLQHLRHAGFRDVVINTAHLGERIEAALGTGESYGLRIAYSHEGANAEEALETAGGIKTALPLLCEHDEPFLVVNGDVFCDYPFARAHTIAEQMDDAAAWLVMVPNPAQHAGGDFGLNSGLLTTAEPTRHTFTFSGIGVYRASFFSNVPLRTKFKMRPLLDAAIAQGNLRGELYTGRWEDIGTPERLAALNQSLASAP